MRRPFAALAGILLLAACASGPIPAPDPNPLPAVTVSAHRGGAGQWPQNSLLAFRNALAAGYGEIEGDTSITRDGATVIYHDATISRTRCPGPFAGRTVHSLAFAQVRRIRCSGQLIPTEAQLLDLIASSGNKHTVLRLETKGYPGQSARQARAWAEHVGREVVDAGLAKRAIMQDFDWAGIAGYHAADPALRVSALLSRPTEALARVAAKLGAYDLSYNSAYATAAFNRYLTSLHLVPTVWGVDNPPAGYPTTPTPARARQIQAAFRHQVRLGARVVITNYPGLDELAQ